MKARRFIPGQVWWLDIDTKGVDGCDHKIYPYLIMSANNRRVIALRMHTGASRASNWIRDVGIDKDGNVQRVILDAPITIALVAVKAQNYDYTLEDEEFIPIQLEHYAAMASQSDVDIFSYENVKKIVEIMASHEDSMFAFGKYVPRPQKAIENEATDDDNDDDDNAIIVKNNVVPDYPDVYPDAHNNDNDGIDSRISAARERLAFADPDDAPYLAMEHAELLQKKREETAFDAYAERKANEAETEAIINAIAVPRNNSKNKEKAKLKDLIIANRGNISLEELRTAANACGITTTFKFEFNELMNDGTIVYTSNRCNCMLKSDINRIPGSKYHRIPNELHASVYADACRFGTYDTAKIWGVSNTTIRRICGLET